MHIVHKWMFLKMVKQVGHAHHELRIMGTMPGELAAACPTCPHPNINLPNNWEQCSPDWSKWNLSMRHDFQQPSTDSSTHCFWLLMSASISSVCSSWVRRRTQGLGWDWPTLSRMSSIKSTSSPSLTKRKSWCAQGSLLLIMQTTTAVLTVIFYRYANMDYILAEVLKHHLTVLHKIITFNIACQWSKSLENQLKKLPVGIRVSDIGSHDELIPMLHVLAHKAPCPTQHSLNYHPGSRHMDGEGIECTHTASGPLGTATKQMGPGYWHNTIDSQWNHWNWCKVVSVKTTLLYVGSEVKHILVVGRY